MKVFVLILGIAIILGCLLFYAPAKEKVNYIDFGSKDEIESVEVTFDSNDPNIYVDVMGDPYKHDVNAEIYIEWAKEEDYQLTDLGKKLIDNRVREILAEYDPNDEIYSYLPEPPGHWKEKYGDVERTRLIHALSEQRIAIALQGRRLKELEDYIATKEWENEMP